MLQFDNEEQLFRDDYQKNATSVPKKNQNCQRSFFEEESEVLLSQTENNFCLENNYFEEGCSEFSDFTTGTTSSCSWHNDDFDMISSNKISVSLEAIDDAIFEHVKSQYISEELFNECCQWSKQFPCLRLKGKQILKPFDDNVTVHLANRKSTSLQYADVSSGLQIIGKRMAIHNSDKVPQRNTECGHLELSQMCSFYEEVLENDGCYEEFFALDTQKLSETITTTKDAQNGKLLTSFKHIEEQIIEQIAYDIYSKVIALLQDCGKYVPNDMNPVFELPPITSLSYHKQMPINRPRTEGTDVSIPDFPKLHSLLSVSPKVLQNKRRIHSGQRNLQSSRPSSEIHLSNRNQLSFSNRNILSFQPSDLISNIFSNTGKQNLDDNLKTTKNEERNLDCLTSFPPVLEEEAPNIADGFTNLYLESFGKEGSLVRISNKSRNVSSYKREGFLPPIDGRSYSTNIKFTNNIITSFHPQLKHGENKRNLQAVSKPQTPGSRPTTGAMRKGTKYSSAISCKNTDEKLSMHNFSPNVRKNIQDGIIEKQVTLFPIVTSLVPNQDRDFSKKGYSCNHPDYKKR